MNFTKMHRLIEGSKKRRRLTAIRAEMRAVTNRFWDNLNLSIHPTRIATRTSK